MSSRGLAYAAAEEEEELQLALAISASLQEGRAPATPEAARDGSGQPRPPGRDMARSTGPGMGPGTKPGGTARAPPPPQPSSGSTVQSSAAPPATHQQRSGTGLVPAVLQQLGAGSDCCPGCGMVVSWFAQHVVALGKKWHVACLRCGLCKEPLHGAWGSRCAQGADGLPYHLTCHKTKFHPVCSVCSNFIAERPDGRIEFKELQFWRDKVCSHHLAGPAAGPSSSSRSPELVQCCSCSRYRPFRGPQWVTLGDGRDLCLECVSSIVVDTKDAQPLYDELLAFYRSMGMAHPHRAPFVLVDSKTLEEYSNREGRDTRAGGPIFHVRGLCLATVYRSVPTIVRTLGGLGLQVRSVSTPLEDRAVTTCSVSAILVMYGLPRLLTGCIIAHELMHAWLRMRNVAVLAPQVEEGMCQLMALLWLDKQHDSLVGDALQQRLASYFSYQIREDTSAVYGDGFRIAYDAFQRHGGGMRGLACVINSVLQSGRIA